MTEILLHKGFKPLSQLGIGRYGNVYSCKRNIINSSNKSNQNIDESEIFAIKMINLNIMTTNYYINMLKSEIFAIIKTNHINIIKNYEIIRYKNYIIFVMEQAKNGDMLQMVNKHKKLNENGSVQFFIEIISALAYMHNECHLGHQDIKLENILLHNFIVKLTDFSFAKRWNPQSQLLRGPFCGSLTYKSPQLQLEMPYNPFAADIYASGVCLYSMIFGSHLFVASESNIDQTIKEQLDHPKFLRERLKNQIYSKELAQLLEMILHPVDDQRLTAENILKHSQWLRVVVPKKWTNKD